jgi:hypothetical protein
MKKMILFMGILLIAVACEYQPEPVNKASEKTAINPADYPYTLDEPYSDWQIGDQSNAILVMKMIKAWETGNVEECASYFADSARLYFDYYKTVVPKDSMVSFIETSLSNYTSVKVEMEDWESVISADQKDEWVTLWYKQSWVDKEGKADSMNLVNDAKIVNGKIARFYEYVMHYPPEEK